MTRNLLVLNQFSDLIIYRSGLPIAMTALNAGDKEVAFFDGRYLTIDIDSKEIARVVKESYSAGTAQQGTVTLAASPPADGSGYSIGLIKTTVGVMNTPKKVYYGATAAAVTAAINADGAKAGSMFYGWSATVSGQVVTVIAPLNNTFRLYSPSGSVIVQNSVVIVPTTGRDVDVSALELYCLPYQGPTNRVGFPVTPTPTKVLTGATYDILNAQCYPVANAKTHAARKAEDYVFYIAVNKAMVTTGQTADDILAALVKLS